MPPHFQNYREDIDRMIGAALAAVDPYQAVRRAVRREGQVLYVRSQKFDLSRRRFFVVAVGKAAVPMAHAVAKVLDESLTAGVIISQSHTPATPEPTPDAEFPQLQWYTAAHPVPDERGVRATTAVLDLLQQTHKDDVVLCLISGGASALLTQPLLPLSDLQTLTQQLLHSGCTIQELNTIRTHLDQIKGGGLAQAIYPAACLSLILSDVIGNPLPLIGSGPTIPATSTPAEAQKILQTYGLLTPALAELWQEKRKPTAVSLAPQLRVAYIIGDVHEAATAAAQEAQWLGFTPHLLTYHLDGEAREVGRVVASLAKSLQPAHAYLLGGETTVTLDSTRPWGVGGRNLELALAASLSLAGLPHTAVATFATDGEDGNSGLAGAIVTGETIKHAHEAGLNPALALAQHDSGTFFTQLDTHTTPHLPAHTTRTGPTGTNVNDLIFVLKYV